MKKLSIVTAIAVLLIGGIILNYYFTTNNNDVKLRNLAHSQEEVNKAFFDKMFKILQQKASIADEYKTAFKEIYPAIIEGRYKDNNLLFKFVQESNPEFKTSLYEDLSAAVEGQRESFFNEQKKLISIKNQHDNLRLSVPTKWFLSDTSAIKITIITSATTKDTFKTGEENDVELFKKK